MPAAFTTVGMEPRRLTSVALKSASIMQCPVQEPTTGDFYVCQVDYDTPAAAGTQSSVISRVSATGALLDSMSLPSAGHGSVFGVERSGGKTFIWWTWQEALEGGSEHDLVRFEYRAGATLSRKETASFTVLPKFAPASHYVLVALDVVNGWAAYRDRWSPNATWTRRKISDVLAGIDQPYGRLKTSITAETFQSFATIGDKLYVYAGTSSTTPESANHNIKEYSWDTGELLNVVDTNAVGTTAAGVYPAAYCEPEGASLYVGASGSPTLLIGVTTGVLGARGYELHIFDVPGADPAPVKPAPTAKSTTGAVAVTSAPPVSPWRYIAQRALTGEFLDYDLPLNREELSWALSGPGSLRGTVSPDVGRLRADDGSLLLEEWGTLLYAEADGEIRWGGILVSSSFNGAAYSIEAAGFATYPHGMPYPDVLSEVQMDPVTAVKAIWKSLQDEPDGDLGVVVNTDATPVRLGKPKVPSYVEVFLDNKWQRKTSVPASRILPSTASTLKAAIKSTDKTFTLSTAAKFGQLTAPFDVKVGTEIITVGTLTGLVCSNLTRGVGKTTPTAHSKGTAVKFTGTKLRTVDAVDAEPYVLAWYETADCGSEIDSLAQETPFDYTERHYWSGNEIRHEFNVDYPRAGRRRTDLAFIQGDNVSEVVTPTLNGDDFANAVLGLGAGEGAKALRRNTAVRDGRLRRTAVYTGKDVNRAELMDARIRDELNRRRGLLELASITVRDHPNAEIGSWDLGDDILVQATLPWLGDVSLWCRVTAWSLASDSTATLTLARSDSFVYGGAA